GGVPVAVGGGEMMVATEIVGFLGIARGHQVPAAAATAQSLQREEAGGNVFRLVVGGGGGGHQPDMGGAGRERRQQGKRLEMLGTGQAAEHVRLAGQHRQGVGQEDGVEQAAFGGSR